MPDRRHLWRGIHDPEMVKSGVTVELDLPTRSPGADLVATLVITSVRVGHLFPTYVTPRVVARLALVDDGDRVVPGSVEERFIGREVTLDLTRELSDTRLPPGGRLEIAYRRPVDDTARLRLRATVTVYPDHFYTGFFEALLNTWDKGFDLRSVWADMGPKSRAYCHAWNEFTGIETPGWMR